MQRRASGMASRRAGAMGSPAALADAVGAVVELAQGVLHLGQRLPQGAEEHLDLAPLGRHLAGVGEVLVERQRTAARRRPARRGGRAGWTAPCSREVRRSARSVSLSTDRAAYPGRPLLARGWAAS